MSMHSTLVQIVKPMNATSAMVHVACSRRFVGSPPMIGRDLSVFLSMKMSMGPHTTTPIPAPISNSFHTP